MRLAIALVCLAGACDLDRTIGLSTDPSKISLQQRPLRFSRRDAVDLLLVLDDSGSMAPKQTQLLGAIPTLVAPLLNESPQLDLHVGVITTDLGAPGITCGANRGGKLQQKGAASLDCAGPTGASYLSISRTASNVPAGQDLIQTIGCMANVGDKGCGFEMPLEAAYRALHDTVPDRAGFLPENQGFLRADAILAVLFLTDEDDCSVDDGQNGLFSADTAVHGPLASYRCTRFGTVCDGQFPLPATPQAGFGSCRPATGADGGKLAEMEKYERFFGRDAAMGGVKDSAADVILAAVRAPAAPFGTVVGSSADVCGQGVGTCTVLQHSCVSPEDAQFFGDPALRIDALVNRRGGVMRSICDASYAPFAEELSRRIRTAASGVACIPGAVLAPAAPDCEFSSGGRGIPRCGTSTESPVCWTVERSNDCYEQLDPRSGALQQLRIVFVGPVNGDEQGSCQVLTSI